jgi:hypothetical protein
MVCRVAVAELACRHHPCREHGGVVALSAVDYSHCDLCFRGGSFVFPRAMLWQQVRSGAPHVWCVVPAAFVRCCFWFDTLCRRVLGGARNVHVHKKTSRMHLTAVSQYCIPWLLGRDLPNFR